MAKINQGILGGVSGAIGNVIGGSWKGIEYIRVKPASVANPRTPAQLEQREKFTVVNRFIQPISSFLKTGYKEFAVKMTGFNAAMSYNILNALTGSFGTYAIDYANALVARGNLAGALNGSAAAGALKACIFTWDDNSSELGASATDKSLLVVYNAVKNQAVTINELATRVDGTQSITLPSSWQGDTVQTYLAFIRADGVEVSDSSFCGPITVLA